MCSNVLYVMIHLLLGKRWETLEVTSDDVSQTASWSRVTPARADDVDDFYPICRTLRAHITDIDIS